MRLLIARKEFTYAGVVLKPGDRFRPDSVEDARLLKGLDKAIDIPEKGPPNALDTLSMKPEAASSEAGPVRTKRAYKRRDMQAEG